MKYVFKILGSFEFAFMMVIAVHAYFDSSTLRAWWVFPVVALCLAVLPWRLYRYHKKEVQKREDLDRLYQEVEQLAKEERLNS